MIWISGCNNCQVDSIFIRCIVSTQREDVDTRSHNHSLKHTHTHTQCLLYCFHFYVGWKKCPSEEKKKKKRRQRKKERKKEQDILYLLSSYYCRSTKKRLMRCCLTLDFGGKKWRFSFNRSIISGSKYFTWTERRRRRRERAGDAVKESKQDRLNKKIHRQANERERERWREHVNRRELATWASPASREATSRQVDFNFTLIQASSVHLSRATLRNDVTMQTKSAGAGEREKEVKCQVYSEIWLRI